MLIFCQNNENSWSNHEKKLILTQKVLVKNQFIFENLDSVLLVKYTEMPTERNANTLCCEMAVLFCSNAPSNLTVLPRQTCAICQLFLGRI